MIQNTAFESHTYKHTTMGFFEDIVDMPNQYDYSIEFFNRYYRPEYCTIIVVGDVTAQKVNDLAKNISEHGKREHMCQLFLQNQHRKKQNILTFKKKVSSLLKSEF